MFERLIGNDQVKEIALRLIRKKRVPNSLIFAGPDGVGKREFAIEIARSLVCTQRLEDTACGNCSACDRVGRIDVPKSDKGDDFDRIFFSEHPDVGLVVPFRRNVRIGAIRALEYEANFVPYEAEARVFIIDDADKMADPAANALLKTLEEPSPTSHIFLITSRPDHLLQTIASRCQVLRFAPVGAGEIERCLTETGKFTAEEAGLVARSARGSVGRALSCDLEQIRGRRSSMLTVLEAAVSTGNVASMFRVSDEMNEARNKDGFEDYLEILESLIHDLWTITVMNGSGRIVNSDIVEILSRLAKDARRSELEQWLERIESIRQDLTVNINRKVASDALFVSMAGI